MVPKQWRWRRKNVGTAEVAIALAMDCSGILQYWIVGVPVDEVSICKASKANAEKILEYS